MIVPRYYLSAYGITSDGKTHRPVGNKNGYATIKDARSAGYRILRPYMEYKGKDCLHGIFVYDNKEYAKAVSFPVGEMSIDRPIKMRGFISYTLIHDDGRETTHRMHSDGTLDPEIVHTYYPPY